MSDLLETAQIVIQNKSRSIDVDKALLDGIERLEEVLAAAKTHVFMGDADTFDFLFNAVVEFDDIKQLEKKE